MKRRTFLRNSAIMAGSAAIVPGVSASAGVMQSERSIMEWRVYNISRNGNARSQLIKYFTDALVPFLKKRNAVFAAFKDYSLEEPAKLYVLISWPDNATWFRAQTELLTDQEYIKASQSYNSIPASGAVYNRYETFLLEAFEKFPKTSFQDDKKGLFELRLYESASEDAGRRKIAMFNNEEIDLFLKVGLMPVFFGRIVAGEYMPALLYMVGFKDMADRDATWAKFGGSESWKTMSAKQEYADTVSNIQRRFLLLENV